MQRIVEEIMKGLPGVKKEKTGFTYNLKQT